MKNICIYHKGCRDGFGAALAVKLFFDSIGKACKFLPANHGDDSPDVTGMNVVIVDFSYKREVLLDMYTEAESIVVLDHHKTAMADLAGLSFCTFDMKRSGAMMAWEYFHPNKKVPHLIKYIQDRDLWTWELPYSKEFSAGLQLLPLDFKVWENLLDDNESHGLLVTGKTILQYQKQLIETAVNRERVRMVHIAGFTVPILNTTTLVSEICGKLAQDYPFAVTYFDTPDDRVYSLRSTGTGSVDVSKIAKGYGGGGHAQASGFSIPHNQQQL